MQKNGSRLILPHDKKYTTQQRNSHKQAAQSKLVSKENGFGVSRIQVIQPRDSMNRIE